MDEHADSLNWWLIQNKQKTLKFLSKLLIDIYIRTAIKSYLLAHMYDMAEETCVLSIHSLAVWNQNHNNEYTHCKYANLAGGGVGIYVHFQNGFENSKLTAFHRKLYLYNLLMINKQKFQRF